MRSGRRWREDGMPKCEVIVERALRTADTYRAQRKETDPIAVGSTDQCTLGKHLVSLVRSTVKRSQHEEVSQFECPGAQRPVRGEGPFERGRGFRVSGTNRIARQSQTPFVSAGPRHATDDLDCRAIRKRLRSILSFNADVPEGTHTEVPRSRWKTVRLQHVSKDLQVVPVAGRRLFRRHRSEHSVQAVESIFPPSFEESIAQKFLGIAATQSFAMTADALGTRKNPPVTGLSLRINAPPNCLLISPAPFLPQAFPNVNQPQPQDKRKNILESHVM